MDRPIWQWLLIVGGFAVGFSLFRMGLEKLDEPTCQVVGYYNLNSDPGFNDVRALDCVSNGDGLAELIAMDGVIVKYNCGGRLQWCGLETCDE